MLGRRAEIAGIQTRIWANRANAKIICQKLTAAMALMKDCDPRRFAYLKRDVKRILVFGNSTYLASWWQEAQLIELTETYIIDPATTPAKLASTLAHETMHACLCRWGFGYEEELRVRVERICSKAEIAFARRLPDSESQAKESIVREAQQEIERDPTLWTDASQSEGYLTALSKMAAPVWLVACLYRIKVNQIKRYQRSLERIPSTKRNDLTVSASMPRKGLRATSTPNPCPVNLPRQGHVEKYPYVWYYRTEVTNHLEVPVRIISFGCYRWIDNQWVLGGNIFKRPLQTKEFVAWYSDGEIPHNGWITPGKSAVCDPNWDWNATGSGHKVKWVYVAEDEQGKKYQAETMVMLFPDPKWFESDVRFKRISSKGN